VTLAETINRVGVGARAGYDIRLGDWVSLWPVLTLAYERTWRAGAGYDGGSIGAYAPAIFPVQHAFVGMGPDVTVGFGAGASAPLEFGLRLTVGGWLDLGGQGSS
jgi:hypothetical protein